MLVLGVPDAYIPHGQPDRILAALGLDGPGIAGSVLAALPGRAIGGAPMTEQMVVALDDDLDPLSAVARSVAHTAPGVLHLAVSLQVVDLSGRWLIQRRAASKLTFAGRWANTCCTHPEPGEDPADAAARRASQEVGLAVSDLLPAGSFVYRARDEASGMVEWEHDQVFVAIADASDAAADPARDRRVGVPALRRRDLAGRRPPTAPRGRPRSCASPSWPCDGRGPGGEPGAHRLGPRSAIGGPSPPARPGHPEEPVPTILEKGEP